MKADDDPNEEEAGTATLGEAAAAAGCVHLDLDDVDLDQILDLAVDLAQQHAGCAATGMTPM